MRALLLCLALFAPVSSFAAQFAHLNGWYEILSPSSDPKEYFLFDNDTVGNIWERRADGPLPADLESVRNEPAVLVHFTSTKFLIFTLEGYGLETPGYFGLTDGGNMKFELRNQGNGTFNAVTLDRSGINRFVLGTAQPDLR